MSEQFNLLGINSYADLLRSLQSGNKLCRVLELRDGTKTLVTHVSADKHYIYWSHFGSSANKATARNMEFVVTRIFKMDLDEFIRRFIWA